MGVFPGNILVNLYLVIPFVAILETLLVEVEGYAIVCDCWVDTPRSVIDGHFDRWCPPCQLMVSMFGSGVLDGVGGGMVRHVLVSRL